MDDRKVKRKLAAIVSTDVKGYSRLMSDDDVETVKSIKACRRLMAQKVEGHRGRVVDSPGDNLLSEFSSVADAVQCAVEIQVALQERNQSLPIDRKMEFRIGINLGDVIEDGDQIYGEGLNIAARIESIAPGGGICISGSAFDQVKKLLPLGYEFLGEKSLKNIPDKVPVYRVLTDPKDSGKLMYSCKYDNPKFRRNKRLVIGLVILCLVGTGLFYRMKSSPIHPVPFKIREKLMQMHLPDKPSIAVLPFMNMSEDPEQEYFSDGLTEDLITDLSKVSGLFVIARNSVFAYKDKAVSINKIGRELGVKYVLEGSVRKVGSRVRITAQLVDAKSEGHIWAERYDRGLEDIFSVQDEVRTKIVTALSVELTTDDEKRMMKKSTSDLMAYDYYLRGLELHGTKMERGLEKSKIMFQKAIDIDPGYARAYAALGHAVLMEWIFGFNRDDASLDEALVLAQKAVAADPDESAGYGLRGHIYLWTKKHNKGIAQIRKAISLGPSNAEWIAALGEQLTWSGKPLDGIHYFEQAMRLDPQYPAWYLWNLGHAHYLAGQYDKAVDIFQRALVKDPNFWPSHAFLALAYDALGQSDKAAVEIGEALKDAKNQSLLSWEDRLPYKDPERAVLIVDRLKKMGFH